MNYLLGINQKNLIKSLFFLAITIGLLFSLNSFAADSFIKIGDNKSIAMETNTGDIGTVPGQNTVDNDIVTIPNPLGATQTIPQLIDAIVTWMLQISTAIFVLMMFIGAFQIMTAAGNPERLNAGKHTVLYTVVGYALLLLAKSLTFIIASILSGNSPPPPIP